MLVILAQASLECAVRVLNFIKLHLELQVALDLLLKEVVHLVDLPLMLGARNCHLLVNDLLGDLLNVDVTLGKFN